MVADEALRRPASPHHGNDADADRGDRRCKKVRLVVGRRATCSSFGQEATNTGERPVRKIIEHISLDGVIQADPMMAFIGPVLAGEAPKVWFD